jgi:hypothetical protein
MTANPETQSPSYLVDLAQSVMSMPGTVLAASWPRASAILGRQALEKALDELWEEVAPGVEKATRRAQLLCLPLYVDTVLADRVRHSWYGLSSACHHHAYELSPIAAELDGWLEETRLLIEEVGRQRAFKQIPEQAAHSDR